MTEENEMLARVGLDPQEALICTMLLVAATDGITDREIAAMSAVVQTLPAFINFSSEQLEAATDAAVNLLRDDNGLPHAAAMIREALEPRLRETAYACACEVVAAARHADQDTLRMLQFVRDELHIDQLVAAAIERGVRARTQTI